MGYRLVWDSPRNRVQISKCGNYHIYPSPEGMDARYQLTHNGKQVGEGFDSMRDAREAGRKHAAERRAEDACTDDVKSTRTDDEVEPKQVDSQPDRSSSASSSSGEAASSRYTPSKSPARKSPARKSSGARKRRTGTSSSRAKASSPSKTT